jgi:hypothetical protein
MPIKDFFYPPNYGIYMFSSNYENFHSQAFTFWRILQMGISVLIFVQQCVMASTLNRYKVQEYLMIPFYSQIFQLLSYSILTIVKFTSSPITEIPATPVREHVLTLVAHALYEISFVGYCIGVIVFLLRVVYGMNVLTTGCNFYLVTLNILLFALMMADLVASKIYFIFSHLVFGFLWMIIWNIFSEALNYYSLVDGFGASFAYCLGTDLLYLVFFTIAAYFQRWKIQMHEPYIEQAVKISSTQPLISEANQDAQINIAQDAPIPQNTPSIVEEKMEGTAPI